MYGLMYGQKLRTAVSQSIFICHVCAKQRTPKCVRRRVDNDRHQKFMQRRTGSEVIARASLVSKSGTRVPINTCTLNPKPTTSTIRGTTPIRPAPLFSLLALPINEAMQSCCCTQIVGVASSAPVVGTPRVNRTGRSTSHIVSRYCISK